MNFFDPSEMELLRFGLLAIVGGLLARFLNPDLAPAVGADRVFNRLAGRGRDEERTIAAALIALWGILVRDRCLC